ncbi:MAG: hypothetical protein U0X73_01665 [Thermoanaerobaculia bacterium]
MGTFHSDTHPLHGITVVVETRDAALYVGRCDDVTESEVRLRDAEAHRSGGDGSAREQFLARVARVGQWPQLKVVRLERAEVVSLRPLAEVASA